MPKSIVIDGYIGQYYFSQQLIRNLLSEAGQGENVEVEISSLGGQLNHALAIHDMFAEHGNISTKLYGFIASAATLIALPTKTRISENSFYLIHKVLTWIDVWGSLNEDDLDDIIEELTKQKNELAKMTLVCAKMYLARAKAKGKSLQDVLNLMKEDTWLNAQEAFEWGFVDEVYKPAVVEKDASASKTDQLMEMIVASGLPTPPRQSNSPNNNTNMKKTLVMPHINQVLNITEMVCDEENGSFVNEESLMAVESELASRGEQINSLTLSVNSLQETVNASNETINQQNDQISQLQESISQLTLTNQANADAAQQNEQLTQQLSESNGQLADLQQRFNALTEKIKVIPAAAAIIQQSAAPIESHTDGVDWETMNNLPHNKFVDNN